MSADVDIVDICVHFIVGGATIVASFVSKGNGSNRNPHPHVVTLRGGDGSTHRRSILKALRGRPRRREGSSLKSSCTPPHQPAYLHHTRPSEDTELKRVWDGGSKGQGMKKSFLQLKKSERKMEMIFPVRLSLALSVLQPGVSLEPLSHTLEKYRESRLYIPLLRKLVFPNDILFS